MPKYTCPVCGYNGLTAPPDDWEICPSCRTEFRYTDATRSHAELRSRWIASGAEWGSRVIPQPLNFDPESQLRNIGYELTKADRADIALAKPSTAGKFEFSESDKSLSVSTPIAEEKPTAQVATVRFSTLGNLSFKPSKAASTQQRLEVISA